MAKQYEYYQEGNTVRTRVMEIPNPEEELLKLLDDADAKLKGVLER